MRKTFNLHPSFRLCEFPATKISTQCIFSNPQITSNSKICNARRIKFQITYSCKLDLRCNALQSQTICRRHGLHYSFRYTRKYTKKVTTKRSQKNKQTIGPAESVPVHFIHNMCYAKYLELIRGGAFTVCITQINIKSNNYNYFSIQLSQGLNGFFLNSIVYQFHSFQGMKMAVRRDELGFLVFKVQCRTRTPSVSF